MSQSEQSGVLLLSEIWGSRAEKRLQRFLSSWVLRKRQARTGCEMNSLPGAFVLVVMLIKTGKLYAEEREECARVTPASDLQKKTLFSSFLQPNTNLATRDPHSWG